MPDNREESEEASINLDCIESKVERNKDDIEAINYEVNAIKSTLFDMTRRFDRASNLMTLNNGRIRRVETEVDGYHLSLPYKNYLVTTVSTAFSKDEFYSLCLDMDTDPELFSEAETKSMAIYEMIGYLHRRKQIPQLIQHLQNRRPAEDWRSENLVP